MCAGIALTISCDGNLQDDFTEEIPNDNLQIENLSIRPKGMDMKGVAGFAIAENTAGTKSDTEVTYSAPYSLYSICDNGEIKLSVFYFEIVSSVDTAGVVTETKIQKEISDALQIVPAEINDVGNYILFSGCDYHMDASMLSEEALAICTSYVESNKRDDMEYLVRKSDGALFDISGQSLFSFESNEWGRELEEDCFMVSKSNSLYVKGGGGRDGVRICKIEDNGDAIDVKQITQGFSDIYDKKFAVDTKENLYVFAYIIYDDFYKDKDPDYNNDIEVYYSAGGFNAIKWPTFSKGSNSAEVLDICIENHGGPYIFLFDSADKYVWIACNSVEEGEVKLISEERLPMPMSDCSVSPPCYLGFYNNSFNWLCTYSSIFYKVDEFFKVLSFNINTNEWSSESVSEEIEEVLETVFDAYVEGTKCYGAKVNGNTIEVTEIDLVSQSYRSYTFSVDLSGIVQQTYEAMLRQGVPYLGIKGKSTANGTDASFMVNLINGENTSTFASDSRNVVSFFRIN